MASLTFQHAFTVDAPPERAWGYLTEPTLVVNCLPGATLVSSSEDGRTHEGTVSVKLGAIGVSYRGTAEFVDIDHESRRLRVEAEGREQKGAGSASMTMQAEVVASDEGSRVSVEASVSVTGKLVSLGRGMIGVVSEQLVKDFAECMRARVGAPEEGTPERGETSGGETAADADAPEPAHGLSILFRAIWSRLRKLFGAGPSLFAVILLPLLAAAPVHGQEAERVRARDLGIVVGVFEPGAHNAITDVDGVRVGHATVVEAPNVRTGVTAILPHGGNPYFSRVPAAVHVGNGFGKLLGVTQVRELGELETPVLLTCTLCVWRAADAMVAWMLARDGMQDVRSVNPVVGETNDGGLNDIRSRPIEPAHVVAALESASDGPVEEGAVGAGAGTVAFGWKGGIGTSSRVVPETLGGHTVGVLVQSNFGGILQIAGAPVGVELGRYAFSGQVSRDAAGGAADDAQELGSIMMVVATDAPVSDRNLERIASRAMLGLARTGSYAGNGSGDYVIAFSTATGVRRSTASRIRSYDDLANNDMSALFEATVEATEEAIYNSLFMAETVTSNGRTVEALPVEETLEILRRYGAIR